MHRKIAIAALGTVLGIGALSLPAMAQPHRGPMRAAALFGAADADRDGRVTQEEAWSALSARFNEADANKDGGVSWEEFRAYAHARMGRPQAENAARAERASRVESRGESMFRALDADRDGRVTLAELRPAAEAMFRARDTNGDNVLSREEASPRHGRQAR